MISDSGKGECNLVHINGKDVDAAGMPLLKYLEENEYRMGTFVVEIDEKIISKEQYGQTILQDGQVVEIVSFMGGGSQPVKDTFSLGYSLLLIAF